MDVPLAGRRRLIGWMRGLRGLRKINIEAVLAAPASVRQPVECQHQTVQGSTVLRVAHIATATARTTKNVVDLFQRLGSFPQMLTS